MSIGIVIPYRGSEEDKSRLRKNLDSNIVRELLHQMTQQVISEIAKIPYKYNLYLMTKEEGVSFNGQFQIVKDQGNDLNSSIRKQLEKMEEDIVMIVMADLPLIKNEHIKEILDKVRNSESIVLAATNDKGTSVLCFKKVIRFPFLFGLNSAEKFKEYFDRSRFSSLILNHEFAYQDIDTLKDLIGLKNLENIPKWLDDLIRMYKNEGENR